MMSITELLKLTVSPELDGRGKSVDELGVGLIR